MRQKQPIDQLEDRGLPGAARPDEGHGLASIDSQGESVQNGRLAGEPERHLAEFDPVHLITIETCERAAS
jgi:hypothetical protein